MTRYIRRLPAFSSIADAIAYCEERGYTGPVLHSAHSEPVVGCAEVDELVAEAERLEGAARELRTVAEGWRP